MSGWQDIVKTIAPVIGTAIGGPFGGMATKFLAGALLGDEGATEDQVQDAIMSQNPEILTKLRIAGQDFKIRMKELGISEEQLKNEDRASARELYKVNKWPQIVLSAMFIVGYFIVLTLMMSGEFTIQAAVKDIVILLIGMLTREVPTIMQFWFGSSSGSKDKTAKLK